MLTRFSRAAQRLRDKGARRTFSPVVLGIISCFLGAIFFSGSISPGAWFSPASALSARGYAAIPTRYVTPTPTPTPTSTPTPIPTPTPEPFPTPTPFVPQSGPSPVAQLPGGMQQEVNTLAYQDRFFYHGNLALPEIALTFDDGPNPPYTQQILDVLKRYNVKASFFCMGSHTAEYPELVKREFDEGHVVGNHTWAHPHLPQLSSADIRQQLSMTGDELQKVTGTRPTFFRPPYGEYDAHVLQEVNQQGLTTFLWNNMALDWTRPAPAVIVARVVNVARDGMIILLHDGGGDRTNTVAALPTIIERLQARGFRFVTLAQMVEDVHKVVLAPTSPTAPTGSGVAMAANSVALGPEDRTRLSGIK